LSVYLIDPLQDERWNELLVRHRGASIFHTRGWLQALSRTYGFAPIVLSTSPPNQDLENGLVLCPVNSRLTGKRLVSVPFSDHCEPLVSTPEELAELKDCLVGWKNKNGWGYIEIRPVCQLDSQAASPFVKAKEFVLHRLKLDSAISEIFQGFHKDSVQRKIRRAEREELEYEEGRSDALLQKFYYLLLKTRRRQQSLPQPLDWFRNLIDTLGDLLKIRIVSRGEVTFASILTIRCKNSLVYKYGCSDSRYNNLGGTHLLFWRAIQEAKTAGLQEFDFGRSDIGAPGLITFKDRWGAARQTLTYWNYPGAHSHFLPVVQSLVRPLLKVAPDLLLRLAGTLLYRHAG
jgi:hypothetical protein